MRYVSRNQLTVRSGNELNEIREGVPLIGARKIEYIGRIREDIEDEVYAILVIALVNVRRDKIHN